MIEPEQPNQRMKSLGPLTQRLPLAAICFAALAISSCAESFEIYGPLDKADVRSIVAAVQAQPGSTGKNIRQMNVNGPGHVTVTLADPTSHGGQLLFMERRQGHWGVAGIRVMGPLTGA